jgi:hypothetical protein
MGLGSENKQERQQFQKVVKHDWKEKVKSPEDADKLIDILKNQDPLHLIINSYTQRKIKELELYIRCHSGNESFKDFLTRTK